MEEFDIVSDLATGLEDSIVPASEGTINLEQAGATHVNRQARTEERAEPPKEIGTREEKPAEGEKPKSLREQISESFKADQEGAPKVDGPARAPNGQFAPKAQTEQSEVEQPAADAPQPLAAPQGIDPEVFSSLPAETQASIARTMEDVATQQQRIAWLSPLEQVITPERINAWAMNGGMQPAQAVHQLLALSDFAARDPTGFIQYMAQQNGVDLIDLALGEEPPEEVDPRIKALQDEVAELRGFANSSTQQQQQAAHDAIVQQVVDFASEKDQSGKPLRPYFEELGDIFLPYVEMVKKQNPSWTHPQVLQQAYENACWNHPGVRGKMQAAAQAGADAERLRQDAAKVSAAKAASVSVRPGTPSATPSAPGTQSTNLRETIRASMASHSAI